jgi:hypothetical protein
MMSQLGIFSPRGIMLDRSCAYNVHVGKKHQGPKDAAEIAFEVYQKAIGEIPQDEDLVGNISKNPAAVALGRLGGLKGGKARSAKLSSEQRSEIARKAAEARWKSNV